MSIPSANYCLAEINHVRNMTTVIQESYIYYIIFTKLERKVWRHWRHYTETSHMCFLHNVRIKYIGKYKLYGNDFRAFPVNIHEKMLRILKSFLNKHTISK